MARSRVIRPEFFTDGDLVDTSSYARLLFVGLWTLADRDGRLADKPRSIKLALLPADDVDVDALLGELLAAGSIRRYRVDGKDYIDIPSWAKYQPVHHREVPSTIPPFRAERAKKPRNSREALNIQGQAVLSPDQAVLSRGGSCSCSASTSTSTSTSEYESPDGLSLSESTDSAPAQTTIPTIDAHQPQDWAARARELLAASNFATELEELGRLLAAENKTGKARTSRVVRQLYEPLVALERELPSEAMLHGLTAALAAGVPNANYVKKAALRYTAPIVGQRARSDRQVDTSFGVLRQVLTTEEP